MLKSRVLFISVLMVIWNHIGMGQHVQPDERGYIVKVGDRADDFPVVLLDGTSKKLSEFKAPVIVLNFFASRCAVCRKEIPYIEKEVWQTMKEQGLIVLGVDYKEKVSIARQFVKDMHISYPVAWDETGEIFDRFARGGVTRNIVLDQNLKIIYLTRLFDINEFEGMKNIIRQTIGLKKDSLVTSLQEPVMEPIFLNDAAGTGKKVALQYQGRHKIHLEGRIARRTWWRKLEIGVSLFEEDIVSRHYDKKTKTLHIGYRHYDGIRIAILPMTLIKVPNDIEQVLVSDVE